MPPDGPPRPDEALLDRRSTLNQHFVGSRARLAPRRFRTPRLTTCNAHHRASVIDHPSARHSSRLCAVTAELRVSHLPCRGIRACSICSLRGRVSPRPRRRYACAASSPHSFSLLAFAAPSWAQTLFQGRIDVTVLDAQGRAVPGVLVEIAGPTPLSQTTDDRGEAHFLNLSPGSYTVTASAERVSTPIATTTSKSRPARACR